MQKHEGSVKKRMLNDSNDQFEQHDDLENEQIHSSPEASVVIAFQLRHVLPHNMTKLTTVCTDHSYATKWSNFQYKFSQAKLILTMGKGLQPKLDSGTMSVSRNLQWYS